MADSDCLYGTVREVQMGFAETVRGMEAALQAEGFGVLCQIDIQAKLKEKLGVTSPRYVILGACNPALAQQALANDVNVGLLLPCNAVVYERDGRTYAGVVDAGTMLAVTGSSALGPVARQVTERLGRVLAAVAAAK